MQAVEIPLSRSKVALVSPEDAERVLAHKWCFHGERYACRSEYITWPDGSVVKRNVMLHRFVLDAPMDADVDHKNGNGLDCQRENLRLATRSQNVANSGGRKGAHCPYKGVFFKQDRGNWRAEITVNYHKRHLGTFHSPEAAAAAYDAAALAAWGEFAYLNFADLKPHYLAGITAARVPKTITNHLFAV